jgi:hypothetical protein
MQLEVNRRIQGLSAYTHAMVRHGLFWVPVFHNPILDNSRVLTVKSPNQQLYQGIFPQLCQRYPLSLFHG